MNKLLLALLFLFGTSFTAAAEEKSRKEIRGDKHYFVYSFEKAIDSYKHAKHLTVEGQRRLAKSYACLEQNSAAENAYSILVAMAGSHPEDYYSYAMVLKKNGKTEQSSMWMNKFCEVKPADLRAKDFKLNSGQSRELSADNGRYKVELLSINTDADDYGTSYFNNQIVFASSRAKPKMIVKNYNWTGKPFGDLYVSDIDNTKLKKPSNFGKRLNGKLHDGPASFSKNGTLIAFTRNNYETEKKDRVVNIEIWFSTLTDDKWSDETAFFLNDKSYSVGHPSLSADGNTMYFSSDKPGGYGGADIYRTTRNSDGTWGSEVNMGAKINTEGNEMFPFYEEKNGILFFTSDGRFGLGGLDIFICPINDNEIGTAVNAGAPLNSPSDDFAVIVDSTLEKGYFSTNRPGGSGGDDIYSVDILKSLNIGKKLEGIAQNEKGTALPFTFITLFDDNKNTIDTVTTNANGAFTFLVGTDLNFQLTGQKDKYKNGSSTANTFGKAYVVNVNIILSQEEEEVLTIKAVPIGSDLAKILVLNNIYFDLNESVIRPDAEPELLKIVKALNANPTMEIRISSYTDCRETSEYNVALSKRRAEASIGFIRARISNPERVSGTGYGETNLVNGCACEGDEISGCNEEAHQKNRRTEFTIIKK